MLSDERIAEIAETHIGRLKDIGHKSGLVIRTDAELACESAIRAALTEQAELDAKDARIRELEEAALAVCLATGYETARQAVIHLNTVLRQSAAPKEGE